MVRVRVRVRVRVFYVPLDPIPSLGKNTGVCRAHSWGHRARVSCDDCGGCTDFTQCGEVGLGLELGLGLGLQDSLLRRKVDW